jgi:three-Cys-motif partner protein
MAAPKTPVWSIDAHTKAKHEILRRYLQAWFPILASFSGRIIYLGGFAGPGVYKKWGGRFSYHSSKMSIGALP